MISLFLQGKEEVRNMHLIEEPAFSKHPGCGKKGQTTGRKHHKSSSTMQSEAWYKEDWWRVIWPQAFQKMLSCSITKQFCFGAYVEEKAFVVNQAFNNTLKMHSIYHSHKLIWHPENLRNTGIRNTGTRPTIIQIQSVHLFQRRNHQLNLSGLKPWI